MAVCRVCGAGVAGPFCSQCGTPVGAAGAPTPAPRKVKPIMWILVTVGLLVLIAVPVIMISIAVPKLSRTQMYTRETAAFMAIRTVHAAETQYLAQYGRYAASLAELGPPPSGAPSPSSADLVGNDLSNGEKQGYRFVVAATPGGYTINATPVTYGSTGTRSFFSDQTMVIHENYGPEPATAQSKELR